MHVCVVFLVFASDIDIKKLLEEKTRLKHFQPRVGNIDLNRQKLQMSAR